MSSQGNTTDMELASLNSDMALACEIKHDDKLTDEDGVYIQVKRCAALIVFIMLSITRQRCSTPLVLGRED